VLVRGGKDEQVVDQMLHALRFGQQRGGHQISVDELRVRRTELQSGDQCC